MKVYIVYSASDPWGANMSINGVFTSLELAEKKKVSGIDLEIQAMELDGQDEYFSA